MRPTFRQLEYIVALAETGRFSAAADQCGVSQPALSSQIAAIEADLGVPLIERRHSGVAFTPAGEETLRRARSLLRDAQDLRNAVRSAQGFFTGRLRMGVLPSIGAYFLPLVTRELHAEYPRLRLFVRESDTQDLASSLVGGDFDCTVTTPSEDPEIVSLPLFSESLWICAPPEEQLSADAGPIPLAALKGKSLVCLDERFELAKICAQLAKLAGARLSEEYRGGSLDAVRQMALMGGGVAVLPSLYALAEITQTADITVRRIDHPLAQHPIVLSWRKSSPLGQTFQELAAQMRAVNEMIAQPLS